MEGFPRFYCFSVADLSAEQMANLRRREALAYESDMFEQAAKQKQLEDNSQGKMDLHLRQLRKMMAHVKVTCEASNVDS